MKNKVYSFISAKGGSGKTILTATFADFLSQIGKRILIIDADGSTNGLSLFYLDSLIEHYQSNKNLQGIFERSFEYSETSPILLENGVSLIPATYNFNNTDCFDINTFKSNLVKTINSISSNNQFDYILIDCQAGSDAHTEVVIQNDISDEVVIVSEYDPISVAGIERLKGFFSKQLTYNRTWILLNKVLPELAETSSDFLEISKYLPPILWDATVVKNYARKEIALDFTNGNEFTLSVIKLIRSLFDKKLKEDLSNWLNEKNEIIKKPIYDEYQKVKEQLEYYENKEKSILSSFKVKIIYQILSIIGVFSATIFIITQFASNLSIDSLLGDERLLYMLGLGIIVSIVNFVYHFLRERKDKSDEYKYEKEVLIDRIKKLELLKHSDIEKILRNNSKKSKKNFT